MLSLWIALPLSLLYWLFCVIALAGSITVGTLVIIRLFLSMQSWGKFAGGIVGVIIWGWLSLIVGTGAYHMGSYIVDQMLLRLA